MSMSTSIDNYTPGTLRALSDDKPGQTTADYLTTQETLQRSIPIEAAYAPCLRRYGEQAQYAICSPITDSDGTLYFKNDSGYLMAFGRSIEKIEVTTMPR